jgi:hypothetical protein
MIEGTVLQVINAGSVECLRTLNAHKNLKGEFNFFKYVEKHVLAKGF